MNDIKLQEGHPVDENLRPIKVGGKATAIETAQWGNGARVNGDLEVTGNIYGDTQFSSRFNIAGKFKIEFTGTGTVVSGSATIEGSSTLFTTELVVGDAIKILQETFIVDTITDADTLVLDSTYAGSNASGLTAYTDDDLLIVHNGDAVEKIKINKTGNIVSTDLTIDDAGDINIDAAGDQIFFKNDGTQFGGIDMGTGSNLKLTSQTDYHLSLFSLGIGDVVVDSNGDIILDSNDGNFIMRKAGVQFSPANSAYAGMILGYTDIGLNEVHASLSLTTSFVVPTDEFSVSFIAPPSGNVAIEFQIQMGFGSSGVGDLAADLSTANATSGYSQLAAHHAATFLGNGARNAYATARGSWTLTGLTAGTSYEYWAAFKTDSTTGTPTINWGGTALRYPDFIMKATALPATITT